MKNLSSIVLKLAWISFFLCLVVLSLKMLKEPDIWWMLRTGEWIWQNGAVVQSDPFSFSHFGVEWINVKWLFEVILYACAKIAGPESTLLIQTLVYSILFYFLNKRLQFLQVKSNYSLSHSLLALLSLTVVLLGIEFRMLGRPEMMSHLMLVLFLFIFERHQRKGDSLIYLLIPLQIIWTNIHEAYGIGLVILLMAIFSVLAENLFLKKKVDKNLFLASVLSILAISINPRGVAMILHPFEILSQVDLNKYTVELVSASDPLFWRKEAYIFLAVFILSLTYLLVEFKKQGYSVKTFIDCRGFFPLLSFSAFFYLGFSAYRNIPFFILLASPYLAKLLFDLLVPQLKPRVLTISSFVVLLLFGVFYYSIVNNHYYKLANRSDHFGLAVDPLKNPMGVVDFMKKIPIQGNGFSDYLSSSYLLWELRPQFNTFIDLRDLDVFNPDFFDAFFELTGNPQKFDEMDAQYDFQYAVVYRPELMALQNYLDKHPNWELVYVDAVTSLFLKQNRTNQTLIDSLNQNLQGSVFKKVPKTNPGELASQINTLFNPSYDVNKVYELVDQDIIAANFFLGLFDYDAALYHVNLSKKKRGLNEENQFQEAYIYLQLLKKAKTQARIQYYMQLAEKTLIEMSRSVPNSPLLSKGMGMLSFYQNNIDQSIYYFSQWEMEDMDFEMLSILSEVYAKKIEASRVMADEDFDRFLKINLAAHDLNPRDFIINYKLAFAYCQLQDCKNALEFYELVQSSEFPDKNNYLNNIQNCYRRCLNK